MAKVLGLAPGPDLTYRPVNARGALLRGSSELLILRGDESKLCGLPLCSSRYFGDGGLWGVAGSRGNLEGLKFACDLGVWKGFGNKSSLG